MNPTDEELHARLAPLLRWRTRFLPAGAPVVKRLDELKPITGDAEEVELLAAIAGELDPAAARDALEIYADWLEGRGELAEAQWMRAYPDGDTLVCTRFGGRPAALRGEPWPRCTCGAPLRFVGQVNGRDAAEPAWFALVTFFYCWTCCRYGEQDCGGADRPWRGWLVRAYPSAELDAFERSPAPAWDDGEVLFYEAFVRPIREQSLPHWLEIARDLPASEVARVDRFAYEMTHRPGHGERGPDMIMPRNAGLALGGYPYWYNGPDETPACPSCMRPMELVMQLEPHEAIARGWGDAGELFMFVCTQHRDWFALRMQCT